MIGPGDEKLKASALAAWQGVWGFGFRKAGGGAEAPECALWISDAGPRTVQHDHKLFLQKDDAMFIALASPKVVYDLVERIEAANRIADLRLKMLHEIAGAFTTDAELDPYNYLASKVAEFRRREAQLTLEVKEARAQVGRELLELAQGLHEADPTGRLGGILVGMALSDVASRLEAGVPIEDSRPATIDIVEDGSPK
jgi:hypothetical protein